MMYRLPTPDDTRALGAALATVFDPGDLIILTGPLGSGKTVLTQGIGAGLGVDGPVLSPTFVLARVHHGGRIPLVHVDAYRLHSMAEVDDMDLDASLDSAVTVVEWGSGLVEQLAEDYLEIGLDREAADDVRVAELRPSGEAWSRRLSRLTAVV